MATASCWTRSTCASGRLAGTSSFCSGLFPPCSKSTRPLESRILYQSGTLLYSAEAGGPHGGCAPIRCRKDGPGTLAGEVPGGYSATVRPARRAVHIAIENRCRVSFEEVAHAWHHEGG